jgi:hypothetical protein
MEDTWVPGTGYSPAAIQWRILCLLDGCLRLPTERIDDEIYSDGCRIVSNKIAILNREEGIGRLRNPSPSSINEWLLKKPRNL